MGRLFVRLFRKEKHEVVVIGREERKARRVAARVKVQAGDITDIAKANIVIVSVPIDDTVEVCRNALQRMSDNTLLVEISSVKTGVVNRVADFLPPKIEYLSLHPLFGPSVRRFEGRNMIAIPVKQGWLSDRMISSLRNIGFMVEILSIEEHDKVMAALQVAHHYAYLVVSVVLAETAKASGNFTRLLTRSLRRTLDQIASLSKIRETVFSIQRLNPYGLQARTKYALSAQRMISMDDHVIFQIEQALRELEDAAKPK